MQYLISTVLILFAGKNYAQKNMVSINMKPLSYINAKPLTKFDSINTDEIFRSHTTIAYSIGLTYCYKKNTFSLFYQNTEKIIKSFDNVPNRYYLANINSLCFKNGRIINLSGLEFIPSIGLNFSFYKENIYDPAITNRQKWITNSVSIDAEFRYKSQFTGKPNYLQKIYVIAGFGLDYEAFVFGLKNIKFNTPLFLSYGINFGLGYGF